MKNEKSAACGGRHVKGSVKAPIVVGPQVYKESINVGVGNSHLGEPSNGVGNRKLMVQVESDGIENVTEGVIDVEKLSILQRSLVRWCKCYKVVEFLANQLSSVGMKGISILRISQNMFLLAFKNHEVKKVVKQEYWVLLDQV
ncbi:hypothetical protein GOBAR_DD05367 [Gossypium barbadense]|nr:hypothetical protein GOBAR_DD05367 [Gossypium barbadense]